jgi:glycosyltransferase involved in cell wall biosynthesis
MKVPIPVLLVTPTAVPGGAERALAGFARHLPTHGFAPSAVLLDQGPLELWLRQAGCPTHVIPAGRMRQPLRTLKTVETISSVLRRGGHELVFSNQAKGHIYGGLAGRASGVPAVWWQHGVANRNRMDLAAACVPARAVVCSTDEAVRAQQRRNKRASIMKVHPGVPADEIAGRGGSGATVRAHLGWEANEVVVIVARLQPGKGQETFLDAAAVVRQRFPSARFAVVGGAVLGWEGDYPERLKRRADQLGLREAVFFAGHQEDVYPWFDCADVVVHASSSETFGLVLLEAMALSKPLVATAVGGPNEIVEDGHSGLLVPPGDVAALARAVTQVLEDDALAGRLAQGGRARATAFSEERCAEQLARLLHDVRNDRIVPVKEVRVGRLA